MPNEDEVTEDFLGDISTNGSSSDTASPFFDFTVEEDPGPPAEPPPLEEPLETVVGDGSCRVCGAPTFRPPGLTKAGHKKRAPRYCDLHAPNARIPQDGPVAARMESELRRIQEELADDIKLFATMAGPFFPVTGYYLFANSDPFTVALLKLCKNNQRALRVLHRAASVAPVYEVAKVAAGVAYSVQVDTQKADAHSTVGQRLGVDRAYDAVYGEVHNQETATMNGFTQPPHYATVQ